MEDIKDKIEEYLTEAKMTDEVGIFWVVTDTNYFSKDTELVDIVFESDIKNMMLQSKGGLKDSEIVGIYKSKSKAMKAAKKVQDKYNK